MVLGIVYFSFFDLAIAEVLPGAMELNDLSEKCLHGMFSISLSSAL